MTLRKLTGREVETCQAEHNRDILAGKSSRGWSAAFQRIVSKATASDADVRAVAADPLIGFNRLAVVRAGLVAWSYKVPVVAQAEHDGGADAVADLDDERLEWAATEIMRLTKPALFQTPADAETERKNAPGSSIAL